MPSGMTTFASYLGADLIGLLMGFTGGLTDDCRFAAGLDVAAAALEAIVMPADRILAFYALV